MTTLGVLVAVAFVAVLVVAEVDRARLGTAAHRHARARRVGWFTAEAVLGVVAAVALLPRLWELAT